MAKDEIKEPSATQIQNWLGIELTMFFQALGNPVSVPAEFSSPPRGGCWVPGAAVVGTPFGFAREIRLLDAERPVAHGDADHMLAPCLLHPVSIDATTEEPKTSRLFGSWLAESAAGLSRTLRRTRWLLVSGGWPAECAWVVLVSARAPCSKREDAGCLL